MDDEAYRRQIKGIRNLQEGRHDLARHVFHGRKGELYQAYREGMEDQLGALGLVLNCITLWNTVYLDVALDRLRADGAPVADEDVARLSPYMRRHLNVHGHYPFHLPDMGGGRRALRDPDSPDRDPDCCRPATGPSVSRRQLQATAPEHRALQGPGRVLRASISPGTRRL